MHADATLRPPRKPARPREPLEVRTSARGLRPTARAQTSYATSTLLDLFQLEVWARYEQMEAIGPTDPDLISTLAARGRGLAGGLNAYFNGHALKVQLDWTHAFGDDLGRGPHTIRLQLDASF